MIVSELRSSTRRIVVCAPSNKAIHEVLSRVRKVCPETFVLFIGTSRRESLPEPVASVFLSQISRPQYWDKVFSNVLSSKIGELAPEMARFLEQLSLTVGDDVRSDSTFLRFTTKAKALCSIYNDAEFVPYSSYLYCLISVDDELFAHRGNAKGNSWSYCVCVQGATEGDNQEA